MFLLIFPMTLPEMWQKVKNPVPLGDFPCSLMQCRTTAPIVGAEDAATIYSA